MIPAIPFYKPKPLKTTIIKSLSALSLGLLGLIFVSFHLTFLAFITYAGMIIQLVFIFRLDRLEKSQEQKKEFKEPSLNFKIISIICVTTAFFMYYFTFTSLQSYNFIMTIVFFAAGSMLFWIAKAGKSYFFEKPLGERWKYFDLIYCIVIFILCVIIFSHDLMKIPPGLHLDENSTVSMSQTLGRGDVLSVVQDSWLYNGLTLLYFYIIALAGKVFGINIITAKWVSVIFGSGEVVFLYLIMKEIFNRRAAVLSSLFLTCFFMQIFFSRMANLWIPVPALAAAGYYFFIKAMKTGKPGYFVTSGVILGLSLYFYSAAKSIPLVLVFFLAIMFIRKETRQALLTNWRGLALLFGSMLLVFLPVVSYIIQNPSSYFRRIEKFTIITSIVPKGDEYKTLIQHIISEVQMFFTASAPGNGFNLPGVPFFDIFTSVLVIAGTGYLLFTLKNCASIFLLLWLFFGLLPGFLSLYVSYDPYPGRMVLAIPAFMAVLALGVERTWQKIESFWPRMLKYAAPFVFAYALIWFSFYNLRGYFVIFPADPHTMSSYRNIYKAAADCILANRDKRVIVSNFLEFNNYYGMMDDLSKQKMQEYATHEDISLFELYKLYDEKANGAAVIGEGIYHKLMPIYKEYFPDAKITTIWDYGYWQFDKASTLKNCYGWKFPDMTMDLNIGLKDFYVYDDEVKFVKLATVEIEEKFTLQARFYNDGKQTGESAVFFPMQAEGTGFDRAEITGLIDVPAYGNYQFGIEGAPGQVLINNREAKGNVELYKGLHRIKIVLGKYTQPKVYVKWKNQMDNGFNDIQRCYLINSDKLFGLNATYYNKGKVIYKQLEPAIDYRMHFYHQRPASKFIESEDLEKKYYIRWDGYINIENAGVYSFMLNGPYDCSISIDNNVVFERKNGKEHSITLNLGKGKKQIRISSAYKYILNLAGPGSTLRLLYKRSGQREFGPVTYDILTPGI